MVASTESVQTPDTAQRKPVVVVQDLHVEYRVFATGKRATEADRGGVLRRAKRTRTVHALKGISFTAYENDSIGIIGSNGSGKSTLMRAITGSTPATRGAIYASSRPSMLGVGAALIKQLSGQRNVILGGLVGGQFVRGLHESIARVQIMSLKIPAQTY